MADEVVGEGDTETILEEILRGKREEVSSLRSRASELADRARSAPPPRPFAEALRAPDVAVLAEFKRRSPSAGAIAVEADPGTVAAAYERGGAAALSILTDGRYFGGSLDDLRAARDAVSLPILRKDFLLDPLQLLESRAAGADAVLLIVRALPGGRLGELLDGVRELGLEALVEVHDEGDLERALDAGAEVVGVNARDLASFRVDRGRALELVSRVPRDRIAVAESGIGGAGDVGVAGRAGADAVLVGSWLMAGGDPEGGVAQLTGLHRRPRSGAARAGGG